ncbi:MAG TPA: type II secretion system F family protein [Aeromicrobium sp.]|nr:type II secretion system F family protein [Aeromicrobium sp.]
MLIVGSALILAAVGALVVALDLVRPTAAPRVVGRRAAASQAVGGSAFADSDPSTLGRWRFLTVPSLLERAKRNIVLGGYQAGWGLRRLLVLKVVAATITGFVTFTFFSIDPSGRRLAACVLLTVLAFVYPDIWLDGRAKERQKQMERDLPDILDQTVIALESGLSFEAALSRIADNGDGPLVEEFKRTLQDMRLGMSRRIAYQALSDRTSVMDVKRFCKQVMQAEEFGVSMSTVVRNRASDMRVKRRYRAEELAQKIPVKIIFPLATCLMPVLFIVILYPTFHGMAL